MQDRVDGSWRPSSWLARGVLLVCVAVLAASCQFTVEPTGTTIDLPGNEILIVVPPGSVEQATTLTVLGVAEPAGPNTVPGTTFDVTPVAGWDVDVTVSVGYQPTDVPVGVREADLVLLHDPGDGWTQVADATVDVEADTVSAQVSVLGRFAAGWVGCDARHIADCTLTSAAALAGVRMGATLESFEIGDSAYVSTLTTEFGALTPENALKMYSIQNQRGVWTFGGADAVVGFAESNGLEVRGHTLVWAQDQFTPAWVKAITDADELREVTDEYVEAVMGRYVGRIPRWDVVNEPLATLGTQRSGSVWDDLLGTSWIGEVFHAAHAIDPEAELWINEYGTDWVPGKHQAFLALVADLVADGVPIHGVGLQTHRISTTGPDPVVFQQQLRDFTDLGLEVAITELDVVTSPTDPAALTKQADAYARIVDACLAVADCVEITTWGITDASTWLDTQGVFPTPTRPLLFDATFTPKPAYVSTRASLATGRPVDTN